MSARAIFETFAKAFRDKAWDMAIHMLPDQVTMNGNRISSADYINQLRSNISPITCCSYIDTVIAQGDGSVALGSFTL
jgi:predicted ester cyclase